MILSAGEALYDMIGTPSDAGQAFLPIVGGSTLNVAMGIARLGRPVAYLTRLSDDYFGAGLDAFLTREGIDRRFVARAAGEQTTLAFVALGPDGHPVYSFYANGAADRNLSPSDLPAALPADVTALHFGSISLVLEPSATTLYGYLKSQSRDRVIALDPNVRASLITDTSLWRSRIDDMIGHADIVKASAEDLEWMTGAPVDVEEAARRWSRSGPRVAFVTDGGRGAAVAVAGESLFVPARAITMVDAVGAGDTFQAAVLARLDEMGLLTKERIRSVPLSIFADIARFAVAAAAITCSRRGADLPRRAEVDTFMAS